MGWIGLHHRLQRAPIDESERSAPFRESAWGAPLIGMLCAGRGEAGAENGPGRKALTPGVRLRSIWFVGAVRHLEVKPTTLLDSCPVRFQR